VTATLAAMCLGVWVPATAHAVTLPDPVKNPTNEALRVLIPVTCPVLAQQAAPEYRAFITGQCNRIARSADPYTQLTKQIPLLCTGDPPLATYIFPQTAPAWIVGCPVLLELSELLT
jgi:hypothetical protein